ncbi:hypothetical protein GCM10010195_60450 [Kitasatospora griseola]|nr:hypothetical protein GCM10010195_60450 [Kitasatospora griseola]
MFDPYAAYHTGPPGAVGPDSGDGRRGDGRGSARGGRGSFMWQKVAAT